MQNIAASAAEVEKLLTFCVDTTDKVIRETDKLMPSGAAAVAGERLAHDEALDRCVRDLIVLVSNCESTLRSTLQAQNAEKHSRTLQDAARELVRIAQVDDRND